MVRSMGALMATTATMLTPLALEAQDMTGTSASADEILAFLESRLDSSPPRLPDFALERASLHAQLPLTQFTGPRENPQHFGRRSRAELNAFADRLVAIAIRHPQSRATLPSPSSRRRPRMTRR